MLRHERFHVFHGLRCGEAFEEEFQAGLGLDLVGLGGFHQREQHGAGVGTFGYSGKEPVFRAQGYGADGVLGRVVVGREQSAVHVANGPAPLVASVGHGLPEQALVRNVVDAVIEDGPNRVEDGNGLLPPLGDFFFRRQLFDIVLDFDVLKVKPFSRQYRVLPRLLSRLCWTCAIQQAARFCAN